MLCGMLLVLQACGGGGSSDSGSVGGLVTANAGPKVLSRVIVTLPSTTMLVGETMGAAASGYDQFGAPMPIAAPVWSTASSVVATTTPQGVINGVAPGNTSVTATVDGVQGATALTVLVVPVSRIAVSPALAPVAIGGTQQLVADVRDTRGNVVTGHTLTWSSSAPAVATVSAAGVVTGVAIGTATMTATVDGVTATAFVTVTTRLDPVARIALTPPADSIGMGQPLQLTAALADANGNPITGRAIAWTSSAGNVATVSATGFVTPVAPGTTTITASCEGQSATVSVTVLQNVTVEIVNPYPGLVSDDALNIVAFVKTDLPIVRVVAAVGLLTQDLVLTPIGALGGGFAWEGRMDISFTNWGSVDLVITATVQTGATGSATQTFTHDPSNVGGGIIPDHKSKSVVPVVKPKIP